MMEWKSRTVKSWLEYSLIAETATASLLTARPAYLFRGQSFSKWELVPSINRFFLANISVEDALNIEREAVKQFSSAAHLYISAGSLPEQSTVISNPRAWWALMQHYHAPTRVLDWTMSPYVAAYFAVEQNPEEDGAVFLVHAESVNFLPNPEAPGDCLKASAPTTIEAWKPRLRSARYIAQQGICISSTNILGPLEEMICDCCEKEAIKSESDQLYRMKVVIPKSFKTEFMERLAFMNITAHSLFPGIDGLGRGIGDWVRMAGYK